MYLPVDSVCERVGAADTIEVLYLARGNVTIDHQIERSVRRSVRIFNPDVVAAKSSIKLHSLILDFFNNLFSLGVFSQAFLVCEVWVDVAVFS